jgi:peptidoglycan/LPS O-acetylase OafA/YrhL
MSKSATTGRLPFIDGLRGLAALAVVCVHISSILSAGSTTPGDSADCWSSRLGIFNHGVDVFFVISGFVIAHSIGWAKVNGRYVARFAIRRSLRLDPPYWVAIGLTIAFFYVSQHVGRGTATHPGTGQLLAHLIYAQRFLGFRHINAVFWTLCIEVQFYLAFVLLLWAVGRAYPKASLQLRAWTTAVAFAASLLWVAGVIPVSDDLLWQDATWCWPHWHKFLLGAVIWYAYQGHLPRVLPWVAVALLAVAILTGPPRPTVDGPKYVHSLWAGVATAVLFTVATATGGVGRWLRWSPFQFLGVISYSVYLVHMPIIGVVLGIQRRVALGSALGALLCSLAVIPMSIAAGWLMNVAIERPTIRLAARFKLKRDDLAGGLEGPAGPAMATPA